MNKILAIIPAYNEEGAIARTVKEVLDTGLNITPLVVNDGSKDRTAQEAVLAGAEVVNMPFNLGIGVAVQTGYVYAQRKNFDIAVQIDGDGQHDPAYLRDLLQPILEQRADFVIGSRFLKANGGYQSSFQRRVGIRFFAALISFLTKCKVTDPTSGFRACNKGMIRLFAQYYPQDFPEPEAIVVAKKQDGVVCEVPVMMRSRQEGVSSIGRTKSFYYMLKVTFAIVLYMLKGRRVVDV